MAFSLQELHKESGLDITEYQRRRVGYLVARRYKELYPGIPIERRDCSYINKRKQKKIRNVENLYPDSFKEEALLLLKEIAPVFPKTVEEYEAEKKTKRQIAHSEHTRQKQIALSKKFSATVSRCHEIMATPFPGKPKRKRIPMK